MFIPDTVKDKTIVLLKPLIVPGGMFTTGHRFLVTSTSNRGLNLQDLEEGRRVIEASLQENVDYRVDSSTKYFIPT